MASSRDLFARLEANLNEKPIRGRKSADASESYTAADIDAHRCRRDSLLQSDHGAHGGSFAVVAIGHDRNVHGPGKRGHVSQLLEGFGLNFSQR